MDRTSFLINRLDGPILYGAPYIYEHSPSLDKDWICSCIVPGHILKEVINYGKNVLRITTESNKLNDSKLYLLFLGANTDYDTGKAYSYQYLVTDMSGTYETKIECGVFDSFIKVVEYEEMELMPDK